MPLFRQKIENNKEIVYKDSDNNYLLRDYDDYQQPREEDREEDRAQEGGGEA